MTAAVIDRAALDHLLSVIGGDPEDLAELLEDFLAEAPRLAAKIRESAESETWTDLRISAHSLKSNARDFGAMTLSRLCEKLEADCKAGPVADAVAQADAIVAAEAEAQAELRAIKEAGLG
ncbi:MAG: Hpt domain-containing protein [Pseudomonadota bacterium]